MAVDESSQFCHERHVAQGHRSGSDPESNPHLATCDIHIVTGTGPWEHPEESYRLSRVLASRGIAHHLDDWGPLGGHDWPYWKHQMQVYLADS